MTQARNTTKIRDLAKQAIAIFADAAEPSEERTRLIGIMVAIIEIATRMDARTGTIDPTRKRKGAAAE